MLLMQALELQGNVAEGLRVFDRLRTLLRDELGTAPVAGGDRHPPAAAATRPAARRWPVETGRPRAASDRAAGRAAARGAAGTWSAAPASWPSWSDGWEVATERGRSGGAARAGAAAAGRSGHGQDPAAGRDRRRARTPVARWFWPAGRPEQTLVPFQPFVEALGHYVRAAPTRGAAHHRPRARRRAGPAAARAAPAAARAARRPMPATPRPSATGCSRRWSGCWEIVGVDARPGRARRPPVGRSPDAAAAASPGPGVAAGRGS